MPSSRVKSTVQKARTPGKKDADRVQSSAMKRGGNGSINSTAQHKSGSGSVSARVQRQGGSGGSILSSRMGK